MCFSVYAFAYTVDFQYEINGISYEFSIPGGGFVRLSELMRSLSIITEDAVVADFMAEVTNVEFSNQDLAVVVKAEETISVGTIKETNNLECQYSSELTEDEVEAINTENVEAGDWVLISLKPFNSEETLTITMNNEDQYIIKITDDQVSNVIDIDENKEYILYTVYNNNFYVLKTDGKTEVKNQSDLDTLGPDYKWIIQYVYTDSNNQSYYLIKPYGDNTKSIRWLEDTRG